MAYTRLYSENETYTDTGKQVEKELRDALAPIIERHITVNGVDSHDFESMMLGMVDHVVCARMRRQMLVRKQQLNAVQTRNQEAVAAQREAKENP